MDIKSVIKDIPPLYNFCIRIYVGLLKMKSFIQKRKDMKVFLQKGDSVIEYVHRVLRTSGNMFFVDAGTLIGIYRDGKLLKRDMDVDMGIFAKNQSEVIKIRNLLIKNGFELKIIFSTPDNGIIQDAFDYNGVRVDMCYYTEEENSDVCYLLYGDNKIIKMLFSKIGGTINYKYSNQVVSIPANSDKYLEERYGKNWKIPDPNYKYWEGPCVSPVEGRGKAEFV